MKRRDFIHDAMHAAAGTSVLGSFGSQFLGASQLEDAMMFNPENDHVLVIIFLNGGNDSLNTVIPLNQMSVLNSLRPHVVLPENQILKIPGTELALHPSLTGMQSLLANGKLNIIRGVGYPDQNYSHFRSSDIWMSGSDTNQVLSTGWMGRYLNIDYPDYPSSYPNAVMPDPLSLELGYSNSLLFQGPMANMSVVINGERDFYQLVEDEIDNVPNTLYGDKLGHVKLIRRQSQVYGATVRDAAQKINQQFAGYPDTSIAQQLKICARLIAGGLRTPVYKVELGGFDTHAAQVDPGDHTKGVHSDLLQQLDEAIVAFLADLKFLGIEDKVTGMTFSEFGRRIVSNASNGTDHGSAGPMFIFGKHVNPGIIGKDYELDASMTYEDNLVYQYDFRQVYGSILSQWLCVGSNDVNNALLDSYTEIPVMAETACQSTGNRNLQTTAKDWIKVYPNPVNGQATIEFESDGSPVHIELVNLSGQKIEDLFIGRVAPGVHQEKVRTTHLTPGVYFVRLQSRSIVQTKVIHKI